MTHTDACKRVMLLLSDLGCFAPTLRPVGLFTDANGVRRRLGVSGEADVQATAPGGRAVAVEVKIGRDPLRPDQVRWRDGFVAAGGLYVLARFRDGEDGLDAVRDAIT